MHAHTLTHTCTHSNAHRHARTHIYAHSTLKCIHPHTCTHIHTHARTHSNFIILAIRLPLTLYLLPAIGHLFRLFTPIDFTMSNYVRILKLDLRDANNSITLHYSAHHCRKCILCLSASASYQKISVMLIHFLCHSLISTAYPLHLMKIY